MATMATKPVLWHIPVSHYNEKARWALDYKGVEHERHAPPPPLHMAVSLWLTRGPPTRFPCSGSTGGRTATRPRSSRRSRAATAAPSIPRIQPSGDARDRGLHRRGGRSSRACWPGTRRSRTRKLRRVLAETLPPAFRKGPGRSIAGPFAAWFLKTRYGVGDPGAAERLASASRWASTASSRSSATASTSSATPSPSPTSPRRRSTTRSCASRGPRYLIDYPASLENTGSRRRSPRLCMGGGDVRAPPHARPSSRRGPTARGDRPASEPARSLAAMSEPRGAAGADPAHRVRDAVGDDPPRAFATGDAQDRETLHAAKLRSLPRPSRLAARSSPRCAASGPSSPRAPPTRRSRRSATCFCACRTAIATERTSPRRRSSRSESGRR